jgi:site-specific DNA recombinase
MRAAIYSRFSTDKQTESSIADQVRVCTEYAEKHGLTVVQRFEDQGISGAAMGNRPGFLAMRDAAKARQFDTLLVMDTTRLARSQELAPLVDRLRFQGMRVIGVQDAFDSAAATADMQAGMSGIMSVEFRKQVRARTHSALETRAKLGRPTGGRCYGYTSQNEPVEEEGAIVAEIFERRANGEGLRAIVRDLNTRAVPTPHGRPWAVSGMHAMLRNERYVGRLVWNRSMWRKDPDSGKRIRVERPESERIVHTDERLRLVSEETWYRVRSRDVPVTHAPNARLKHALSGLLLCGECGKPMTLAGGVNSRGMGSRRYVCRTYKEHRDAPGIGCSNNLTVSRAVAEELLIEPLRARLLADDDFLAALERLKASEPDPFALPLPPVSDAPSDEVLAAKLDAIRAAEAAGAMSRRDAEAHCARLRADHERAKSGNLPSDPAVMAANAEALRAALVSGAIDALRASLRRTLGTVRVRPTVDGGEPYLHATFEGGDMPLMTWLAVGDSAEGISALVAGAGFEPATFGL